MNDFVYPVQKTPEGWYLNVHGAQTEYSVPQTRDRDEYAHSKYSRSKRWIDMGARVDKDAKEQQNLVHG